MPIYVGGQEINPSQIQVGGTPVQAVYVGSQQVWPVGSVLPAGQIIGIQNGNALGAQSANTVIGPQSQPLVLPAGNIIGAQSGDALGIQADASVLGTQDQAPPSSGAHDHFDSFATDPGLLVYESLRTNQSITDSALSTSQVFDYWSVNNTIEAAEARMGKEYVSISPHVLTGGYLNWNWPLVTYVSDPGTWVSMQFEMRYSHAYFVDSATYLGGSNLVQKVWNVRDGSGVNINGLKTRIGGQYETEKIHEIYYRTHKAIGDYVRAGENVDPARAEPLCCVATDYPGWPGISRRNNQPGLPETLAIDQDRSNYTQAGTWTGNNTPAWLIADKWVQMTVHHGYMSETDQRLVIDIATEDFGPYRMLESEITPGLGLNRYTDPPDPNTYGCAEMVFEWDSSTKGSGIALTMPQWAALDLGDGIDYSHGVRIWARNVIARKSATMLPTVRPIRVEP